MGCQRGAPEFHLGLTVFTGSVLIVEMAVVGDDGTETETERIPFLRKREERKMYHQTGWSNSLRGDPVFLALMFDRERKDECNGGPCASFY